MITDEADRAAIGEVEGHAAEVTDRAGVMQDAGIEHHDIRALRDDLDAAGVRDEVVDELLDQGRRGEGRGGIARSRLGLGQAGIHRRQITAAAATTITAAAAAAAVLKSLLQFDDRSLSPR